MSVLVVGGGPAGLACAVELRRRGVSDVTVVDREEQAGGIPRHCEHQGFGVRDLRRALSGPKYAERYVELALDAGVVIRQGTMATGWDAAGGGLELTTPDGRETAAAEAIVLATGCRERPRATRLVPGTRPEGVLTTGLLQQLAQRRLPIGTRALIVGAEHVSYSALLTLAHARVAVAGMVTELPRQQSLPLAGAAAKLRYRVPLWTRTEVAAIRGRQRVEEVELRCGDGETRVVACDTVVFTGDWIPDHELAVLGGLELDSGTGGPRVDGAMRTSRPGLFAAGNVVQGAEPADVAALAGRHTAAAVAIWLQERDWPAAVPVSCLAPLRWVSPNAVSSADVPPRGRFLLRSEASLERPRIEIRQDGRVLWGGRLRRLVPGRSASLPSGWTGLVNAKSGRIEISAH
jgi:thioredoxin reductase